MAGFPRSAAARGGGHELKANQRASQRVFASLHLALQGRALPRRKADFHEGCGLAQKRQERRGEVWVYPGDISGVQGLVKSGRYTRERMVRECKQILMLPFQSGRVEIHQRQNLESAHCCRHFLVIRSLATGKLPSPPGATISFHCYCAPESHR